MNNMGIEHPGRMHCINSITITILILSLGVAYAIMPALLYQMDATLG